MPASRERTHVFHYFETAEIDREVDQALADFRKIDGADAFLRIAKGVKVGVDGSVALVDIGVGKAVIGFIFGQKGLMYNLTPEGSKFTKLDKK